MEDNVICSITTCQVSHVVTTVLPVQSIINSMALGIFLYLIIVSVSEHSIFLPVLLLICKRAAKSTPMFVKMAQLLSFFPLH